MTKLQISLLPKLRTQILSLIALIAMLAITLTSTTALAAPAIKAYNAEYELKWNKYKMKAKAKRSFGYNEDGSADISQTASAFVAKITQQASFRVSNDCSVNSESYEYKRKVLGKKKTYSINFSLDSLQFEERKNDESFRGNYTQPLYDELSYQVALRCQVKNLDKKGLLSSAIDSFPVRTKGKNKIYHFKLVGKETVKTKLGKVEAIKVERQRSKRSNDGRFETYIWFAPEYDYVMVKFEQYDNDDVYSLNAKKIKLK